MNSKLSFFKNQHQMSLTSAGGYWPSLFVQMTESTVAISPANEINNQERDIKSNEGAGDTCLE
jgi:hypothetical protein